MEPKVILLDLKNVNHAKVFQRTQPTEQGIDLDGKSMTRSAKRSYRQTALPFIRRSATGLLGPAPLSDSLENARVNSLHHFRLGPNLDHPPDYTSADEEGSIQTAACRSPVLPTQSITVEEESVFTCYYTNCMSLYNKMAELRQLVVDSDPHIVALTESWLTADILDGEISLPGYNIFRGDSNRGRSGGVTVYLRDNMPPSHVVQVNSIPSLDQLWLQTKLRGTDKLLLGIIYRSPSCPASTDAMLVQHILDVVYRNPSTHLLIMGDFNLPTIGWNGQQTRTNGLGAELFISTQQHSWTQHVKEPTRFRSGQTPSLLDLIFTNESHFH